MTFCLWRSFMKRFLANDLLSQKTFDLLIFTLLHACRWMLNWLFTWNGRLFKSQQNAGKCPKHMLAKRLQLVNWDWGSAPFKSFIVLLLSYFLQTYKLLKSGKVYEYCLWEMIQKWQEKLRGYAPTNCRCPALLLANTLLLSYKSYKSVSSTVCHNLCVKISKFVT